MEGWIKLHRKLLESMIFQNENILKIWVWCLLKASHSEKEILVGRQIVSLKKGEFVTGRKKAAEELKINENTFYTNIKLLERLRKYQHQKQQQIFSYKHYKLGTLPK